MDIREILSDDELSQVPQGIVAKLESAFRSELAAAVERETAKGSARFAKLLESVSAKADAQIAKAVNESVSRMKDNAMSDRMYGVLKNIAAVLENAGIPTSEVTKKLKEELAQCNVNLKKAYAEREHVKAQLNEQTKMNYIYKEVQGMRPEIVDAVMQHFRNYDIREIDREAISKFIDGVGDGEYMLDVDPEAGGELNMDRVTAALSEIDHDLELDVPNLPSRSAKKPGRFESLGKGLKAERVAKCTPNVTFESLAGIGMMDDDDAAEDVAGAISQFRSMEKFGGFV